MYGSRGPLDSVLDCTPLCNDPTVGDKETGLEMLHNKEFAQGSRVHSTSFVNVSCS